MSPPFKRILLATEGTEFDVGAERVGIDLAASCGVPLQAVLPLVSNAEYESLAPERAEQAEAEAVAKIDKLRLAAQARGVQLHSMVRLGEEPFREIVDAARDQQADLIVLRRRGKRGFLANLLLGEMVHTVTGHAPCNVLIVPRAAQLWNHAIVLATDGSPHSDTAAAVAAAVAVRHGLPLTVVSVSEAGDGQRDDGAAQANVAQALAVARSAGAAAATGRVIADGKPYEAILAAVQETGADLVVMGRRGLNRMERILFGSTSEQVASHANCPVLIVQQAASPAAA
ncbi:MAG: universal stress protein [Rhodocyclaceae bacterium]|nr:universal stress protein [Rhodocyclaceae bacterium]